MSPSRSQPESWWASSAPTARASPRSSTCSRAFSGPTAAACCSTVSRSPGAVQKTTHPAEARTRALEALEQVGLADKADAHARVLSTGQRKRLEMARALASRPRLLLLDEVTGGVDQRSIPGLVELVRTLNATGVALVVIEHNMRVIMGISQRVVALHLGEVICDAPPQAVMNDHRVIEAYLGRAYAS